MFFQGVNMATQKIADYLLSIIQRYSLFALN